MLLNLLKTVGRSTVRGRIDWVITESELNAVGSIGGRQVRCLSVDYQVRSHVGYTLQDTDFADLRALQEKYGVKLLAGQIKEIL